MTFKGWRECVIEAVRRHDAGDSSLLELTAKVLEQQDQAKQALRDKGYGCTGMDIIRTVELVPSDGDHPLSGGNP